VLISTITTCKGILFPYKDHNQRTQKRGKRQGRGENTIGTNKKKNRRTRNNTGRTGQSEDEKERTGENRGETNEITGTTQGED
jgi:hypothetical protein